MSNINHNSALEYKIRDMKDIEDWLKNEGTKLGWKKYETKNNDLDAWRLKTKCDEYNVTYQVMITHNDAYSDILQRVKENICVIAETLNQNETETYRKIIFHDLKLDDVLPFRNEEFEGVTFKWSSDWGFGEYNVYRKPEINKISQWYGDSECMDSDDDKRMLKELMRLWSKKIDITD